MLTRCTSLRHSCAASSCASTSLVRGQSRLSAHRSPCSGNLRRVSVVAGAGRAPDHHDPDPDGSPHRKQTTAAEHVGVQTFLQHALGISEAAVLGLIRRGSWDASSFLRLSDCHAWVTYLTQLAGGNTATVKAILHRQASLLSSPFQEQRLRQLQSHLQETLDIEPPQLLLMVTRRPQLLQALPNTVAAATDFLLSQFADDRAALRKAVVSHPDLLRCSVAGLQATQQWVTGPLRAPAPVALRLLPFLAGRSINNTLEPWRKWCLQHGLTPAQVLSLAQAAPASLAIDMEGELSQLKLRYWLQQLGYSFSDLTHVPVFMPYSMIRIASRHSALRHLRNTTPSHTRFLNALIHGGGSTPTSFGPVFYAAYVKQYSMGSHSVQEVLMPLSASLSQPALKAEWEAELLSHPRLEAASTSARKHAALYAALHAIQQRDWALSDAGRGWLADEAAAKAADLAVREAERAAARLARKHRRPRQSSGSTAEGDAS